nr:6-phosphogluconolactonase [Angustibacter aerolatus]
MQGDRRGDDRLDAQARVGGDAGASEVIVLCLHGRLTKHGASTVTPLLLPDSPVVAWWPSNPPKVPSQDPIGRMAQRRITDAATARNPRRALADRRDGYAAGDTDLAWTRVTKWRGLLAAALDQPPYESVEQATVTGASDSASTDLLAAWLGDRLGCTLVRGRDGAGSGLHSVRLHRSGGSIDLVRSDGSVAVLVAPGQPDRRIPLPRRPLAECLAEEPAPTRPRRDVRAHPARRARPARGRSPGHRATGRRRGHRRPARRCRSRHDEGRQAHDGDRRGRDGIQQHTGSGHVGVARQREHQVRYENRGSHRHQGHGQQGLGHQGHEHRGGHEDHGRHGREDRRQDDGTCWCRLPRSGRRAAERTEHRHEPFPRVVVHRDKQLLVESAAARLVTRLVDAQASRGVASVVLTGGGAGTGLLAALAASPARDAVDWSRVDVWWGDERFLPSGDPERNETQAREALLDHVPVDPARVHAMGASDGPDADVDAAAARYADEPAAAARASGTARDTVPAFDVLMLGVGPDAHVASLFPEMAGVHETERTAVGVHGSPKPPPLRVSLTLPAIAHAEEVWLVVAGADKAQAVGLALSGAGPVQAPAGAVAGRRSTLWLLDRDAATHVPAALVRIASA